MSKKPQWMVHKCWECLHYQPLITDKKQYIGQGLCKESSPVAIKVGVNRGEPLVQAGPQKQLVEQPVINSYQPTVGHEWPACKKFDLMPIEYQLKGPGSGKQEEAKA